MKTINLKGKEYAPVKERIKAFHEDNANGAIETTWFTAFEGQNRSIISFKAIVKPNVENENRVFTGHALGKVSSEKAFEKLETIAVGRALANCGYLADGDVASADEMERYYEQGGQDHEHPENTDDLPEAVRHLRDRYPFDRTLKTPKNDHRPYLNDGSDELKQVEQDIVEGTLDPMYLRYFYTVTNRVLDHLKKIPAEMQADEQFYAEA